MDSGHTAPHLSRYDKRAQRRAQYLTALLIALLLNGLILLILYLLPSMKLPTTNALEEEQACTVTFEPPFAHNAPSEIPAALIPGRSTFGPEPEESAQQQEESVEAAPEDGAQDGMVTEAPERVETPPLPELPHDLVITTTQPQDLTKFALANLRDHTKQDQRPMQENKPASPVKSLTQLSAGFLDSLDKGGSDLLERAGDPSKRPSIADAQWISYTERIGWHLQKSLRICGTGYTSAYPVHVAIRFTIDQLGNTHNLSIIQSAGSMLDQAAHHIIKSIGSFAPIPKHLEREHLDVAIMFEPTRMGIHYFNR